MPNTPTIKSINEKLKKLYFHHTMGVKTTTYYYDVSSFFKVSTITNN